MREWSKGENNAIYNQSPQPNQTGCQKLNQVRERKNHFSLSNNNKTAEKYSESKWVIIQSPGQLCQFPEAVTLLFIKQQPQHKGDHSAGTINQLDVFTDELRQWFILHTGCNKWPAFDLFPLQASLSFLELYLPYRSNGCISIFPSVLWSIHITCIPILFTQMQDYARPSKGRGNLIYTSLLFLKIILFVKCVTFKKACLTFQISFLLSKHGTFGSVYLWNFCVIASKSCSRQMTIKIIGYRYS